jgi:hypothetical protein
MENVYVLALFPHHPQQLHWVACITISLSYDVHVRCRSPWRMTACAEWGGHHAPQLMRLVRIRGALASAARARNHTLEPSRTMAEHLGGCDFTTSISN